MGDDTGTEQCPVTSVARVKTDSHRDSHLEGEGPSEEECCMKTCWAGGWRGFGDESGTMQCPENKEHRESSDTHSPEGLLEEDCCKPTCGASGFTSIMCPAGSEYRSEWHECHSDEARTGTGQCTASLRSAAAPPPVPALLCPPQRRVFPFQ